MWQALRTIAAVTSGLVLAMILVVLPFALDQWFGAQDRERPQRHGAMI